MIELSTQETGTELIKGCCKQEACAEQGCQLFGAVEAALNSKGLTDGIVFRLIKNVGFSGCPFRPYLLGNAEATLLSEEKPLRDKVRSP